MNWQTKLIGLINTIITFKYDPLGRRTEKKSEARRKHFVWDGNTII